MKNKVLQLGFTLIEVAIVIAILMILMLFVFPAYSNYTKKAKVAEGLALASTAKLAVTYYGVYNIPLTSVWTPPNTTETVTDIIVHLTDRTGISSLAQGKKINNLPARNAGEIVIVFSTEIAPNGHNELVLSPRQPNPNSIINNGHELPMDINHHSSDIPIIWECNSANPPSINRGTRGNLPSKLSPTDCRA